MDVIFNRRSIRRYAADEVSRQQIRRLLEAAMAAPSAGNQQPWHFVVITDPELKEQVPEFHPFAKMIRQAPVAIAVCADLRDLTHEPMWVQDCAAATQNILLQATAMALGSVWLGIYPRDERVEGLRKLLGLPDYIMPFSLVPIGKPGEFKEPNDRYLEDRVHQDRW